MNHCRMRDPVACGLDVAQVVMSKFDRDSNEVITALGQLAWAIDQRDQCGVSATQDQVRRLIGEEPLKEH